MSKPHASKPCCQIEDVPSSSTALKEAVFSRQNGIARASSRPPT